MTGIRGSGGRRRLVAALLLCSGLVCARSAPRQEGPRPFLRVLVTADFGDDTFEQWWVSRAMASAHERAPFDLGFAIGDNVYDCGPEVELAGARDCAFQPDGNTVLPGYRPPPDPLFHRAHESALARLRLRGRLLPIYVALGNHDVAAAGSCGVLGWTAGALARARACLEVAHRSPQWIMPGRHYVLDEGPARFIVFDSNLLEGDYGGFALEPELAFIRESVAGCGGRRCFLVAHHPPAAARARSRPPFEPEFSARAARVEAAAGKVAAWFAGHIHDLQHLRMPAGYDLFISGSSARSRGEPQEQVFGPAGARALFGSTDWGYAVLEIWPDGWSVRFVDSRNAPLHCCRATGDGRCEPVACGATR